MASAEPNPEDYFASSRMSFGEHIEELRTHLVRALKALLYVMILGFVLDAIGAAIDQPWLGIGRPAMEIITAPVREQLKLFHDRRLERLIANRDSGQPAATEITSLQPIKLVISPKELARIRGDNQLSNEPLEITVQAGPVQMFKANRRVQEQVRPPDLTTLSVQESMMVYLKVGMLCSLIIASPYVFWQIWSFVAAGLYPHEKHYVTKYLPLSLGLFLGGVALAQFAVIPQSIGALLWFNDWLGFNPDLRLSEWLGFALLLPLVFGVSFQTPLAMLFLERIGVMTVTAYWANWRIAVFVLAVIAAFITPTPDAPTMMMMWLPLCGLYFFGIFLCRWAERNRKDADEKLDSDELLEV